MIILCPLQLKLKKSSQYKGKEKISFTLSVPIYVTKQVLLHSSTLLFKIINRKPKVQN